MTDLYGPADGQTGIFTLFSLAVVFLRKANVLVDDIIRTIPAENGNTNIDGCLKSREKFFGQGEGLGPFPGSSGINYINFSRRNRYPF